MTPGQLNRWTLNQRWKVRMLAGWEHPGHPLTVEAITRDDVRAFVADQLERWKPLTALNRYRGFRRSLSGRWPRASWTPARRLA